MEPLQKRYHHHMPLEPPPSPHKGYTEDLSFPHQHLPPSSSSSLDPTIEIPLQSLRIDEEEEDHSSEPRDYSQDSLSSWRDIAGVQIVEHTMDKNKNIRAAAKDTERREDDRKHHNTPGEYLRGSRTSLKRVISYMKRVEVEHAAAAAYAPSELDRLITSA